MPQVTLVCEGMWKAHMRMRVELGDASLSLSASPAHESRATFHFQHVATMDFGCAACMSLRRHRARVTRVYACRLYDDLWVSTRGTPSDLYITGNLTPEGKDICLRTCTGAAAHAGAALT